jgi:hypothetical protein
MLSNRHINVIIRNAVIVVVIIITLTGGGVV